ncbi:MAG TPA: hypothetical protein VD930_12515 [Gemmatimonadales bacterium]|nr:hypothetical protein [Gemmatimonadales bacterium]
MPESSAISYDITCKGGSAAPLPPRSEGPVLVMFSGGSDSTLTASLLSELHPVVHLVTYEHKAMSFASKSQLAVENLRKAHGADRFVYSLLDINSFMARIFFRPLPQDLRKYGTYALPMCCGSCKLSMHVRSILYCYEHGIRYAADGSNAELSELFPEQMKPVLELYRQLYQRYGIEYTNPVFDVSRSDHQLFDRGVTTKRDYKTEHVVYTNQHSCAAGVMLYGFTLGVGLPLLGTSAKKDVATRYIADKIEHFCVPFLDAELLRLSA